MCIVPEHTEEEHPTLRVTCLASGSSGNSILVEYNHRAILVDAGLSTRKLLALLGERGLRPGSLDGILLTHEHTDHTRGAEGVAVRMEAPLVGNAPTLDCVCLTGRSIEQVRFSTGEPVTLGGFEVSSFPVSHDAASPVGYLVDAGDIRVAVLTDLGSITPELIEPVSSADLVVLEANHETRRLIEGPYPQHLKRRILSDRGHLSNRQSAELIGMVLRSRPQTFWLAHLSRTNNTKREARTGVLSYLAGEGVAPEVLITDRDRPSLVWEPPSDDVQLSLFGSMSR